MTALIEPASKGTGEVIASNVPLISGEIVDTAAGLIDEPLIAVSALLGRGT